MFYSVLITLLNITAESTNYQRRIRCIMIQPIVDGIINIVLYDDYRQSIIKISNVTNNMINNIN